ncbi:MAG: thioredoxin-disulfide reductase [Thermoplasmata archaeon]
MEDIRECIIIGSGPSGLTAGIYAGRAGLKPLLIGGATPGGQLMLTTKVENFPGFPEGIDGPELMQNMREQAQNFGVEIIDDNATSVDFSQQPFLVMVGDRKFYSKTIIVSTGADSKWLGIPSEEKFKGRGVSSCATCDGAFFRNKKVVVIGGGDTAIEDSLFLTRFASEVTLIHRRAELRASKINQERALNHPKMKFIWDSVVEEILGSNKVTGIKIKNVKTNEIRTIECDGVFVAIGHSPNTSIFKDTGILDEAGYVKTKNYVFTDIEGVFACGDVVDKRYMQAITAAGTGCMAAIEAEKYLREKKA